VIDRVHFQNFKSLANVSLDLGRFTVLVGANGCGKSSVLQGMHLLAQTGSATPTDREPGLGRFTSIYSGARSVDRLINRRGGGEIKLYMRASDGDELELMIRVATTALEHPPELVVNIEVEGRPVWQPISASPLGDRFAIEFDDGSVVPADLLSEGTVIALGILTKLREPRRPRLVLIDDVDRGLHLEAQAKLVQVLRALMKLDPELQIDWFSSAAMFPDWAEYGEHEWCLWQGPTTYEPLVVVRPRTWLLAEGWKKHSPTISCWEAPSKHT
jgi:hypothetical protein